MVPTASLFLFLSSSFFLVTVTGHYPAYQSSVVYPPYWTASPIQPILYACPVCPAPPPPPPEVDPEIEDILEYTKKIGDTVCNVGATLTEIGAIAIADDPAVGATIVLKLQEEVAQGSKVFSRFAEQTSGKLERAASGGRSKRAAKEDGAAALNKVGDVLAKANDKIGSDTKKLSAKAQAKINKKHKDGLDKCGADSCKAAAKLLAAAADGEDERQK